MISADLDVAVDGWRAASEQFLDYAAASTEIGVDALDDAAYAAQEEQAEAYADRLIEAGDAVLAELDGADDAQVAQQVSALLSGTFDVGNRVIDRAQTDVAVDAVDDGSDAALDSFSALVKGRAVPGAGASVDGGPAVDAASVPDLVLAEFEEIEDASGKEIWKLGSGKAVSLAAPLFSDGLDRLLTGAAKEAWSAVRDALRGLRRWAQRAVAKVVAWVTDKLIERLPDFLADKAKAAWDGLVDRLTDNAGSLIGSGLGYALGRPEQQALWQTAVDNGWDTTAALAKVPEATAGGIERIGWVSTARGWIERFEAVVKAFGAAHPAFGVALGCAMAAAFLFVAWQLDDGIDDIGALAPTS